MERTMGLIEGGQFPFLTWAAMNVFSHPLGKPFG